jgi:hypothetical protein
VTELSTTHAGVSLRAILGAGRTPSPICVRLAARAIGDSFSRAMCSSRFPTLMKTVTTTQQKPRSAALRQ